MFRLLPLLLIATPLAAQPLITDRPDFTESGVVVPLGSVQPEFGGTVEWEGDGATVSGPELLVRWAPFRNIELRFGAPDYIDAESAAGWADGSLGAKVQFGPVADWDLAAIVETSVPTGEAPFGSDRLDPLMILIAGREVGPVSVGAQGEVNWTEPGVGTAATLVGGVGLTERLGSFLELAVFDDPDADPALLLHHGYTFLVTPLVQLDIHAALGLTEEAPDALLGLGLSFRR